MATASTAPPTIDSTISGILKNGRNMGTNNRPPKNAAPYAAASAATRTSWRIKPSRQPRTTSNKSKMTAKETKTACQSGEPATAWSSGFTSVDRANRAPFAAARDHKAPWPPSLPRLALPEEEHTDHGDHAPRAWLPAATWLQFFACAQSWLSA